MAHAAIDDCLDEQVTTRNECTPQLRFRKVRDTKLGIRLPDAPWQISPPSSQKTGGAAGGRTF